MKKVKKVPMRKCIGCNESKPKGNLIRIVKTNKGEIFVDRTGKANGRGAYVCSDIECLHKAEKNKALQRVFSSEINKDTFIELEHSMEE